MIAERIAAAFVARDFDAMAELIAEDAVFRSPVTMAFQSVGRANVLDMFRMVRDVYEDLEYTDFLGDGHTQMQAFRARVEGVEVEAVDILRLDQQGRVRQFTVFYRPLRGLAQLAAAMAPKVARRRSRCRVVVARSVSSLLALATRLVDRAGARLVG